MRSERIALVLGATGGIGGEVTDALLRNGWAVRALHRRAASMPARRGVTWIQGDAMVREDVVAAATGTAAIIHAVNPPGYRNWNELVVPMVENSIAAAQASGARIVLPGTIYNYGPDAFPLLREESPQRPRTRKGAIRVEMERRLRDSGVPVLIVRFGDFFGPKPGQNWFSGGMVKPGKKPRSILDPNTRGVAHSWAYLPDAAAAIAQLLDKPLDRVALFHFAGHVDRDGGEMTAAIQRAVGGARVWFFPWFVLRLLAPFVTLLREMKEMRYLWRTDIRMDNRKLVAVLGAEPHTPLDEAVRTSLRALNCI
ncbi:NAD(P)H-binding protein [Roseiterribacter gracilis]|uniref:Membrane protein n=1 Tax=Roseiterribacter gracilis TaxID=2812848 RepID=A0A8S8XGI4_9PROT|nr:membrane protein [Rhodospirillales bacterium TMPK1]